MFDDSLNYNLFLYSESNPINHLDKDGHFFKKAWNWIKQKTAKYVVPVVNAVRNIITDKKLKINKIVNVKTYISNLSPNPPVINGLTSSIETGNNNVCTIGEDRPVTFYTNPTEMSSGVELNIFNIQISFNKSITGFSGSIGINIDNKYYGATAGFNANKARIYGEINSSVTEKNVSAEWYLRGDFSIFYLLPIKVPIINPSLFPATGF